MHKQFITDVANGSLEPVSDSLTVDDEDGEFDPSDAETVTLDSPWNEFFDTSEYIQFDATVAQPIVQPYFYDGQLHRFKKDEQELRKAQAQLDNAFWTMGHPEHDRVTTAEEIRGFWSDPVYDDGQHATLNIPANDTDAVRFAVHNDEISVGFNGDLDWTDDSDSHDAVQVNMAYDHVASVENGRCPPEKGCGLHTDESDSEATEGPHGHVTDAVQSPQVEDPSDTPDNNTKWSEGDWVTFSADGERHHGKIAYVDNERALVKRYDEDDQRLTDTSTAVGTSSLSEWIGPYADSCEGPCSCGCHDPPYADEAPDGIHVEDGNWFGIAPSETADDEPKYELNNCNDVKDAYNLRTNGDYDIDTETLVSRIKRASGEHGCSGEQTPWTDTETDSDPTDDDTTIDSQPMSNPIEEFLDEHDLNAEDILDGLDVEVPEGPTAFYDGQPDVETLADDFDAVAVLADEKDKLEQKVEDVTDELDEYKRDEFVDKADELADLTETFGDSEELVEQFDEGELTLDGIEEKIAVVEDVRENETTTVDSEGGGDGDDPTTDNEPDFEKTDSGKIDLRKQTKN